MHNLYISALVLLSFFNFKASAFTLKASIETDPIAHGQNDSDDAAFYFNENDPNKSEVLAVSKCDEAPHCGGLYIHNLHGKTKQVLNVGKLNNVDSTTIEATAYAFASNREDLGISVFRRTPSDIWQHLGSFAVLDRNNEVFEPYGICALNNKIAVSSKEGMVYIYTYENRRFRLVDTIDLKESAAPYDNFIKRVTLKSVTKKKKLYKLDRYMKTRFVSEGCVFNKRSEDLYISQERLGIWRYSNGKLSLVKKIEGSHAEPNNRVITDDLEGIDILYRNAGDYLVVSSQGINKILFLDMNDFSLVRSDSYIYSFNDPVTETDGVAVVSQSTPLFPEGFMILHDDENTDKHGKVGNGNYKFIDLRQLNF